MLIRSQLKATSTSTATFRPVFLSLLLIPLLMMVANLRVLAQSQAGAAPPPVANPAAPDQSEALKSSKDPDFILRNFKTMFVDAQSAQFFGSDLMKSALYRNGDFDDLHIYVVDDPAVADVVLVVSYTFAWDYPFELRHQNTTTVLLAGKGFGPFSGPLGAASVADEFVNLAKKYRVAKDQNQKK